jgi:diphthine-ammonia ligase
MTFAITRTDSVKLHLIEGGNGWSIHQCSFGSTTQSVVMLAYTEDAPLLQGRLKEARKVLRSNLEDGSCIHASYLDVSIEGMWDLGNFGGIIPCRSIWGDSRKRLAAVMVLDIP